ncbi:sensor histidine kinase [Thermodesulfovibrio yellowstonii]|uniref:histidine kinase n=1 Tax=Thermodesulfovibrio yellowstonii (strain ATCC 51303 / DSM 11347 / YP87) TaxID=289376 RepID=B5YHF5_THEYD|nr:ATP-binding protein [Thermodesulfovibrio yellowstonii]ACI20373.1 sensor histidine kinase/response regulator [Thermodesulfovibrio yellowstonii DSM 11347]
MAKFILSIKWLFVMVIFVLVTGILTSNYLFSYHFYKKFFDHHIDTVSALFQKGTENITKPVEVFLYNVEALVCCRVLDFNEVEKTNRFLMEFMKKYPYVTSINYGDGNGNGYLILNDRGKWLNRIKRVGDTEHVVWNTLNNDGKIIKKIRVKDNYDPRKTVWYNQALHSKDIQWSKEYIFRTTKDPGVTASLKLCRNSKQIVGIDIMIKDLSVLLNKIKENVHPETKLYLLSNGDHVIAYTDEVQPEQSKIYTLDEKKFPLLFKALNSGVNASNITFNNQKWFVNIKKWENKNRQYSLVVLIPHVAITKSLRLHLFYQSFFSLLLTFFVFLYISRRYIEPLIDISKQMPEIGFKKIYLEKHSQRTDEIGYLSRAISDVSVQILKAKEIERKIQESNHFESVRRSLGEAVHRFKDIINIIQGFATLAQPKVSNEFAKNALDQIINASKRAIYLTKEILNVTGERKYEMKITDLNSIILSMKTKIEVSTEDSIKIVYEILNTPLPVKLDIEAFDEVLMNLVLNAKDAMPEGGTLTIKTKIASFLDKQFAVLSVSDTGVGMDEETIKRIFEPFFTTKGAKGTGLGLSIVYKIIKDHSGFIEVQSEIGKGTTFKIYLPLIKDVAMLTASSTE